MTAGGLTAKQMAEIRKAKTAAARQHTATMYRVAGYATKNQRAARKADAA